MSEPVLSPVTLGSLSACPWVAHVCTIMQAQWCNDALPPKKEMPSWFTWKNKFYLLHFRQEHADFWCEHIGWFEIRCENRHGSLSVWKHYLWGGLRHFWVAGSIPHKEQCWKELWNCHLGEVGALVHGVQHDYSNSNLNHDFWLNYYVTAKGHGIIK